MNKLFNFILKKAKRGLYYILYNLYIIIAVCFYVAFFIFSDMICTKYFFIEMLLFGAGVLLTYIYLKNNPDLLIDEMEQEEKQAEIEHNRKQRADAVLDWNITYEWAVLIDNRGGLHNE